MRRAVGGSTIVSSSTTPSPIGKWSGQIQYHAVESGQSLQEAHSVALLLAEFTHDGKVMGNSAENGCKLLGVWSQGSPTTIAWLDITLDGCKYSSLNRRFTGSFLLARPDSSGLVQLVATEYPRPGQGARQYDLKGTLHR